MQSLIKIQFFQNGIFAEGFIVLFKALKFNKNLKHMKINDNIVKSAVKVLIEISDSLIGAKNSVKLFETLKVFFFNIILLTIF